MSENVWELWMRRALDLASSSEGLTSPNPLVGAIVLDHNYKLAGEGFHIKAGEHHAEIYALNQAGKAAINGTLIVTLEPCCHQGRTPPCTDAIIGAGITRVVVSLEDPDPRVSGKGIKRLKEAGLEVISGILKEESSIQNKAFIHRIRSGKPWGVLKWAMSLDGRTALPNGVSKWVSTEESRKWVYQLRSVSDAVIVGGGTLRVDNPLLTTRGLRNPEPLRVVLSKTLDLPPQMQIWDTTVAPTIVAHGIEVANKIVPIGPERVVLERCMPLNLMKSLSDRGCNKVLWECGPSLATIAIQQDCVQELAIFIAPKLLGGVASRTPLGLFDFISMNDVFSMDYDLIEKIGKDLLLRLTF